ncbi:MAG TPA: peptidase S8 [Cyanobacteria bacterium UBA11149]|nr:peptidase S8 [Cyanobacteria bacterium UBA11367]HBE59382.1 peptidase S8 [Cyanobacteria bacterium UBA11366]HBK64860.1 peptidase S8 [Cyanobacteria bacterium UBA11166]HBR72311.1 peptidase S8 [Cyanobacteria bacterium UBA11159]HBS70346.1 peptidase S8 [Cyanobacteria bacterium UBA11153]HBW91420.1 peptidase S8 [Cyanobacteria bacterium UBA11149]HCA96277.1 peptidase S8 [Cyanobacteria bacterium UBA9226]
MPEIVTIPGITELWRETKGNPHIAIAILDGPADLECACFKGANFSQIKPYWAEDIEINDRYSYYLNLAREFAKAQKAKKEKPDCDKDTLKKERELFFQQFPQAIQKRIELSTHATHISSTILGQHGSPVTGIAPHCRAINIPITFADDNFISPINLTHAINTALKAEVNIIHIAACQPTQTGIAYEILARAVKQCQDKNILIIAPAGNNRGECWCIPAIMPGVLTVGAMRDNGQPFKFSNYGGDYQNKGVIANGENILGAQPGSDEPIREKGTSCAAPIVTGVAALLMSLQLQRGEKPNGETIRQAILNSAIPCHPDEVKQPERCLMGKLNIPGAYNLLIRGDSREKKKLDLEFSVTPSAASNLVYVLGKLGYDFGTEARRDSFKQLMPGVQIDGTTIPANPYDPRQMVDYLAQNPAEAKSLIWTLNQEVTPIYALEGKGGFAPDIYQLLQLMLAGQIQPQSSEYYIERVSIPGQLTHKTVELFSGQIVPVIRLINTRGMYAWQVNSLVNSSLQTVQLESTGEIRMCQALTGFLQRVYYDLTNLGRTAKDRALNFAVTNVFQAAYSFAEAISTGMQLDSIEVNKSLFCRINSDCWDVKLKFFDPENSRRAKKVYLFTIDVSDTIPVTLGKIRSWAVSH